MNNKATFAAGCFWWIENEFLKMPGVIETSVGYSGGNFNNPTYKDVCSGKTGHAEAVRVIYDTDVVSYEELLKTFWDIHDPTQYNRQGHDVGRQYRSVVFYHDETQKKFAEVSKDKLEASGKYDLEIVTSIEPAGKFWPAEDYHQKYFQKMGR